MLLSACLAAALLAAGAEAAASLPPLSLPRIDFLATEIVDVDSPPASDDPLLSRAALEAVAAEAIAWAASHGLLMHAAPSGEAEGEGGGGAAAASRAPRLVHAPFSLFPAAYPAEQLTQASAVLAPLFGQLVDRVGRDVPWLSRTLKGAADSDDFTRQLLRLCAQIQREGEAQGARLAILRSDYMLHEPLGAAEGQLLQVELNTIASSFGALAARVGQLQSVLVQRHPDVRRHVWRQAGSPSALSLPQRMPPSAAVSELAAAMARAHTLYEGDAASILFVVQPDEANALDQDALADELWASHGVRVVRRTLAQIANEARLVGKERRLVLGGGGGVGRFLGVGGGSGGSGEGVEVSVVYFRSGYTPSDYPTGRHWEARATIERSRAVKCPCIQHQLVGCKKVQQQLALPGELERFVSSADAATLRTVFAGLWSLDGAIEPPAEAPPEEHEAAHHMRLAMERPDDYVMKPQREGGGHNLFGEELVAALQTFSREQRSAYILMQRIAPRRSPAVLVRDGTLMLGPAVSELGVYSTLLTAADGKVILNQPAGHLVRTKLDGVNEGGVAAGFAVLSSPLASGTRTR